MHTIKMMIKTSNKLLSQFIKRVNEYDKYSSSDEKENFIKEDGLRLINNKSVEGFSAIEFKNFRVEAKELNCNYAGGLVRINNSVVVLMRASTTTFRFRK